MCIEPVSPCTVQCTQSDLSKLVTLQSMQLPGKYMRLRYFDKRRNVYRCAVEVAVARLGIEELKDKQKDSIESVREAIDGHLRVATVFVALPTGYIWKISNSVFMLPLPGLAYSVLTPSWPSDTNLHHSNSDFPDFDREGSSICLQ